jgi:hypothetical protein
MQPSTKRALLAVAALTLVAGGWFALRGRGAGDDGVDRDVAARGSASATGGGTGGAARSRPGALPQLTSTGSGSGSGSTAKRPHPGIGFGNPGTLAAIPDHYELTSTTGNVFVNMAGGRSEMYSYRAREPGPARTIHGKVVDAKDRPVAGAVVLVATDFWIVGGSLGGSAGATSDAAGEFAIDNAATGTLFATAMHATGWSDIVTVGDTPITLRMRGHGTLAGRATYNGHGESFAIHIATPAKPSVSIEYESDPDGRFTIASIPPGAYHVSIGLAQQITGGVSKTDARDITIEDGKTVQLEIAQVSGTIVVVSPKLPADYKPETIEYYLFPASAAPPDATNLRARGRAEKVPSLLFGGQDALVPTQFHDVAAGSYLVCAEADRDRSFACTPVTVIDGDSVREIEIAFPPPAPAKT